MPTYEYQCLPNGHRFEVKQSFADASLTACQVCDEPVRKVYSAAGLVFKGSGYYVNDSRKPAPSASNGSSEKDGDGGGDAKGGDGGTKDAGTKDGAKDGGAKDGGAKDGGSQAAGSKRSDAKGSNGSKGSDAKGDSGAKRSADKGADKARQSSSRKDTSPSGAGKG